MEAAAADRTGGLRPGAVYVIARRRVWSAMVLLRHDSFACKQKHPACVERGLVRQDRRRAHMSGLPRHAYRFLSVPQAGGRDTDGSCCPLVITQRCNERGRGIISVRRRQIRQIWRRNKQVVLPARRRHQATACAPPYRLEHSFPPLARGFTRTPSPRPPETIKAGFQRDRQNAICRYAFPAR
jgi:hypothetical protein